MKNIQLLFCIVIFLLCSCSGNKVEVPTDSNVSARTKEWKDRMSTLFPAVVCQPEQYLRKCFNVVEDECIQGAVIATKTCIHTLDEQIIIANAGDGGKWGNKVGSCVGKTYADLLTMQGKKISSADCNDLSKWINKAIEFGPSRLQQIDRDSP